MIIRRICWFARHRTAAWMLLSVVGSCSGARVALHEFPSFPPTPAPTLRAAVARADITPPPGLGLAGNGPEGRRARGYRTRLFARVLLIEDRHGERIALVTVDLGMSSILLQRAVAAQVCQSTGLGIDRIVIMATHTHSGPSHFLDAWLLNAEGSSISGYDPDVVTFLATRIAQAITIASRSLLPARVAWGSTPIWGETRNRSIVAFMLNHPPPQLPAAAPSSLDAVHRAIDPMWTMLRVDIQDSTGAFHPAGAFSVFAIHGTVNPAVNELYDADIQGMLERHLERHIDSAVGRPLTGRAIHLVANGTEGDVSPDWPGDSRCPAPQPPLWPLLARPKGRTPSSRDVSRCVATARTYLAGSATRINQKVSNLFDSLGQQTRNDVDIVRAFRVLAFRKYDGPGRLCTSPRMGTPTAGGAEDARTRFFQAKLFGLIPLGFEERQTVDSATRGSGCQQMKHILLGPLAGPVIGRGGLPEYGEFSVVRIGGWTLTTVPAEVTVTAGARIRDSVAAALKSPASTIVVTGLTNGYLDYVATEEEYRAQQYEGASTLYGPGEAVAVASIAADLARSIQDGTPEVVTVGVSLRPGAIAHRFPHPHNATDVAETRRLSLTSRCEGDTLTVSWIDARPGQIVPADGSLIRVEAPTQARWADSLTPTGWSTVVSDDDPNVEVREVRAVDAAHSRWEMRWSPVSAPLNSRVVLESRTGVPAVAAYLPPICYLRAAQ